MYAITSAIQAKTAPIQTAIQRGIDQISDTDLALRESTGFRGCSLLLDEEAGRCIFTTSWRSAEDMHANAEAVRAARGRAASVFGGGTQIAVGDWQPRVEEWEIAVQRTAHGASDFVRLTSFRVGADQLDRAIDAYATSFSSFSAQKHLMLEEGLFTIANLLIDRVSGHALSAVSMVVTGNPGVTVHRSQDIVRAVATEAGGEGTEVVDIGLFESKLANNFLPLTDAEKL